MNNDRLSSIDTVVTARGVFLLLDTLSQFPEEQRLACLGVLLLRLCDAHEADPAKVLEVSRNWIADNRNKNDDRMKALDFYIRRNILRK